MSAQGSQRSSNSTCELETHSELVVQNLQGMGSICGQHIPTQHGDMGVLWKILCDITWLEDTGSLPTLCPHCQHEEQLSDLFASLSRTM